MHQITLSVQRRACLQAREKQFWRNYPYSIGAQSRGLGANERDHCFWRERIECFNFSNSRANPIIKDSDKILTRVGHTLIGCVVIFELNIIQKGLSPTVGSIPRTLNTNLTLRAPPNNRFSSLQLGHKLSNLKIALILKNCSFLINLGILSALVSILKAI